MFLKKTSTTFKDLAKCVKLEISNNKVIYTLLFLILIGAFFVRAYRTTDLMAFHYDQARDALKIWRFWHEGDIFVVGPVTGLAGIFLGPLYYFMIAPLYLVSGGSPLYPALFLACLVVVAIFITYLIGKEMQGRVTGLMAAFIVSFSYYLVLAGRWVSNPTPIFLGSAFLFYALYKIIMTGRNIWWLVVAVAVSASLQFEAASAFFYLPILAIFYWWQKGKRPSKKIALLATAVFFVSIVPQIIFGLAHQNMLFENFINVFTKERSFRLNFWDVLDTRANYFWTVFASKILPTREKLVWPLLAFSLIGILSWKNKHKADILKLFLIFLGTPVVFYTLFQGNHGNMYDYYMTGYYIPMIILFALGLGALWQKSLYGKIVVFTFLIWFAQVNGILTRYYLIAGVDGPTHVSLGNELQAVRWVYEDGKTVGRFNTDFYVPPVIPYTYDYLFLWQGSRLCSDDFCGWEREKSTQIVYILYEVDPPHPERLTNWLAKYTNTTIVLDEMSFGGITVQKRQRLMQ